MNAIGFADLHLHTLFSDGTFTPEELAQRGSAAGLLAMALTDHDTVEGCEPMALACKPLGIEFIPGTELTAEHHGNEVHLLGYFLDIHHPALLAEIKKFQTVRQDRVREMAARLNQINVPLRAEAVFELANCRSPGRPHVARAMVQQGLCASLDEAFERFLKKGKPAWVPKYKISAVDAMDLVHQAGGLAVLAHPGLNHRKRRASFQTWPVKDWMDWNVFTRGTRRACPNTIWRWPNASNWPSRAARIATVSAKASRLLGA